MMKLIKNKWNSFLSDEDGATAMEYGLIIALIAVGLMLLLNGVMSERLQDVFNKAADGVTDGEFDNSHASED